MSEFYNSLVGLKQWETISTILASLFLEDLEQFIQNTGGEGIHMNDLILITILFEADMVIFGETSGDLQKICMY